jgi:peptidyl-prolyl cis-trans isomerase SurA
MKLALTLLVLLFLPGRAPAELVDGIAAIVDDDVILISEVESAAAGVLLRLEVERGPVPREVRMQIMAQALQALIDGKLIADAATRLGLEATEAEIDEAIAGIAREEGIAVDELYAAAARQGLEAESYREKLREEITRMKVVSTVAQSRVEITDEEIQNVFDERYRGIEPGLRVRGRHILLPWPPEATSEDREVVHAKALEIRQEALDGKDFGGLARVWSQAPTAFDGGLTVFKEGEVAPELEPYVFGMKVGDVSPPVHTRHGVNLIKVLERFDPSQIELADVRASIQTELLQRETDEEFRPWVEELRENRYIEVVAPELR